MTALFLAVLLIVYAAGAVRMRRLDFGRMLAFAAGVCATWIALGSRVDTLAHERLSAHMAQHLVLWLVAPPLLVWGRTLFVVSLALPARARRVLRRIGRLARGATHPIVVWTVGAVVLWGWHLPGLYEEALRAEVIHTLEHLSFIGAALLFWNAVLTSGPRRRVTHGAALALVFASMLSSGWLAMLLSFVPSLVYPVYAGPGAIADQHLAGVLMWVPMGVVYAIAMAVLFVRWFAEIDRRMRRVELPAISGVTE